MTKKFWAFVQVVVVFAAISALLFSLQLPAERVSGAPMAVPTPVTQDAMNSQPRTLVFWDGETPLTEDGRSTCHQVAGYNQIDLHWIVDHDEVNTTTFTLEFTNISGSFPDGIAMLSTSVADADNLSEFEVFGNTMCIWANVATDDPLDVTVVGSLK